MASISPRLIPHPADETGVLPDKGKGGWFIEDVIWGGRVYVGDFGDLTKLRSMIYGPGPRIDDNDATSTELKPGQVYAQEIDVMRARYIQPLLETAAIREAQLLATLKKNGRI
jgi:hypothetical protein